MAKQEKESKFIKFIEKYGQSILSVIFFIDFCITSGIWIASSPFLSATRKNEFLVAMVTFSLFPWMFQAIFKFIQIERKKSGNKSYPKTTFENTVKFRKIFNFFYGILIFSLTRVMDFIEFNELSHFGVRLILIIAANIFIVILLHIIITKYKKIIITIFLVTYNLIATLGFTLYYLGFTYTYQEKTIDPHVYTLIAILGLLMGILSIVLNIVDWIKKKEKKKSK